MSYKRALSELRHSVATVAYMPVKNYVAVVAAVARGAPKMIEQFEAKKHELGFVDLVLYTLVAAIHGDDDSDMELRDVAQHFVDHALQEGIPFTKEQLVRRHIHVRVFPGLRVKVSYGLDQSLFCALRLVPRIPPAKLRGKRNLLVLCFGANEVVFDDLVKRIEESKLVNGTPRDQVFVCFVVIDSLVDKVKDFCEECQPLMDCCWMVSENVGNDLVPSLEAYDMLRKQGFKFTYVAKVHTKGLRKKVQYDLCTDFVLNAFASVGELQYALRKKNKISSVMIGVLTHPTYMATYQADKTLMKLFAPKLHGVTFATGRNVEYAIDTTRSFPAGSIYVGLCSRTLDALLAYCSHDNSNLQQLCALNCTYFCGSAILGSPVHMLERLVGWNVINKKKASSYE